MPEFYYNDGAGVRKVREFYYNDGGGVRKIKEAWYNDGTGVRKFFSESTGTIVSPFSAWNVFSTTAGPSGLTSAMLTFATDGTVFGSTTLTDDSLAGSLNWFTPTQAGAGNSYWIRATVTSGSITTGVVGSWVPLTSNSFWTKSASSGSASCTLTIEISSDDHGGTVVFTSTGNVLRYAHNVSP